MTASMTGAVLLSGVASFVLVISLWTRGATELRRAWARYAAWAKSTIDALHLPLRPVDVAARHAALLAFAVAAGAYTSGTSRALLFGALAAGGPFVWASRARKTRRKLLESQLDAALQTIANNMLATQNLVDGFQAVATHLPPPISQEAELVVRDVRIGARVDEALANLSQRCQSLHVDAVVTALAIGSRTGGDLGKVLKSIAHIVRETIRVEGVMAAKTSEGKTSAAVMGMMPVLFAVTMDQVSPEWMEPVWHDPVGPILLTVAAALTLVGVALVLKISKVDP